VGMEKINKRSNIERFDRSNLIDLWKLIRRAVDNSVKLNALNLIDTKKYKLHSQSIAHGANCEVYFLENVIDGKSFVVKITKGGLINTASMMHYVAKEYKRKFEFLQVVYGKGIIPDEFNYVTTVNDSGRIGVVTIQEFAGSDIHDVFDDITEDGLISILKQDKNLREKFILFVEKTINLRKSGYIIDFEGYRNLILYLNGDKKYDLKFIDPHDIWPTDFDRMIVNPINTNFIQYIYPQKERYLQKIVNLIKK